ncbi:MAG: hypothetical protein JNL82_22475 [Myxococcales bacterium]|nr:hypothetical protein [Myxococcales bacterium]
MLHRAAIVPTTLAATLAACQISPDPNTTLTNGDVTSLGETSADTGGTTEEPPTSSEPTTAGPSTPTTDGPTTQTTPGDTTDTAETTESGGDDATIFQVQNEEFPLDTVVTIKGVVITTPMVLDKNLKGTAFVEEPEGGARSGIQLFLYEEVAAAWDAPAGTVVDITATYSEYYDNSQLIIKDPADITVIGPGELPAPAQVAAADVASPDGPMAEDYEGVIVELSDVTVTGTDIGQLLVTDGAIVSDFFLYPDNPFTSQVGDKLATVVGPLLYSFEEFQVAPRTPDDLVEDGGGDTTGTGTDTDTDTTTGDNAATVYDIQQGVFTVGDVVTVEGVVATSGLTFKKDGFFVEDPAGGQFSGIFVYVGAMAVNVAPGDVLTITGSYDEFFDASQIKVAAAADVKKTGTAPLPAAEVLAPADIASAPAAEPWEGVLVQVDNVMVSKVVDMFGEFQVNNVLQVNDLFFAKVDWVNPSVGTKYTSLTGVLEYSFDVFKLSPTKAADIKP